jgi:hypothetical protein
MLTLKISGKNMWKQIPYAPKYEVSDKGQVMNTETGKLLKPSDSGEGHLFVRLSVPERGRTKQYIARLVHDTYIFDTSRCLDDLYIHHIDGNKSRNTVANLRAVGAAENSRLAARKRRFKGKALSTAAIKAMRNLRNKGKTLAELAATYGVSIRTVRRYV